MQGGPGEGWSGEGGSLVRPLRGPLMSGVLPSTAAAVVTVVVVAVVVAVVVVVMVVVVSCREGQKRGVVR